MSGSHSSRVVVTVKVEKKDCTRVVDALVDYMDRVGAAASWTEDDGDLYFELMAPYDGDNPPPTIKEDNEWLLKMAELFKSYGVSVEVRL